MQVRNIVLHLNTFSRDVLVRLVAILVLLSLSLPIVMLAELGKASAKNVKSDERPFAAPPIPFAMPGQQESPNLELGNGMLGLTSSVATIVYDAIAGNDDEKVADDKEEVVKSGAEAATNPGFAAEVPSEKEAAVETAVAMTQPPATVDFDFDEDTKSDVSRWDPVNKVFQIKYSGGGGIAPTFSSASSGAKPAPADYDGDGNADAAVFDSGTWYIRTSSDGTTVTKTLGQSGDIPASGNYIKGSNGDELAVYRPSNGTWYWRELGNTTVHSLAWGVSTDVPVSGDYDADGGMDWAIYRPSTGYWWILFNSGGYTAAPWGIAEDIPVAADYDGDGKTDFAVFRPSSGTWWIYKSYTATYDAINWGNWADQPVIGDFNGDGKADLSVWRPSSGVWYVDHTNATTFEYHTFGSAGDVSANSAFVKQVGGSVSSDALSLARLAPRNVTGGTDLYSQNFAWGRNLLSLPGRAGLDLNIGLSYNSLVWTKQGSTVHFDTNNDNVTPGFNLGFATIEQAFYDSTAGKWNYLMITPSGARVQFRQVGATSVYETLDSSYLQLKMDPANSPEDPPKEIQFDVYGTDGTRMSYSWSAGAFRCVKITDRNGNYLSMAYNQYGYLQTATDTLQRVITVNYDAEFYPTSITQTWASDNGGGSGTPTHTWAAFTYTTTEIQTDFGGVTVAGPPNGTHIKVLEKVMYPDTSWTKFLYNGYGQVKKIENYADDNHILNYTETDLADLSSTQSDCPRFTETRIWTENFNLNGSGVALPVIVGNDEPETGSTSLPGSIPISGKFVDVGVTGHPDGLYSRTWYASSGLYEGLVIATQDCTGNDCSVVKRWTWNSYQQDDHLAAKAVNPRIVESRVGDDANVRRTTIKYLGANPPLTYGSTFGLVEEVKVYAADLSTVIKKSTVAYNLSATYIDRRIIGLRSETKAWGWNDISGSLEYVSRSTFEYDYDDDFAVSGMNQDVSPVQHDGTNYATSLSAGRGNMTKAIRWDIADDDNSSLAVETKTLYNKAGSVVAQITPWDGTNTRTVKIGYADYWNSSNNPTTYAYPTSITDPANNSSTLKYRYDIGANVRAESPAAAGNPQGKITEREFDSIGRLSKEKIVNNGAYTRYEYPANGIQSKVFSTIIDTDSDGADADDEVLAESWTDGAGRVLRSRSPHTFSGSAILSWAGTLVEYDLLGRVARQSVPTEVDSTFSPAGDDLTRGWLWTQYEYDWMGRTTRTINTDGTDTLTSYVGCGCAGGLVTTVQGENIIETDWQGNYPNSIGRRTRKIHSDSLGRTWKAEVLNWNGSVYTTTESKFNGRDQALSVTQTEASTGIGQITSATFDGHGRLKTQHKPEQDANKSTVFEYNKDDSLLSVTDARLAVANYEYNSRGLVHQISYGAPQNSTIYVPPSATFSYDNLGNRIQMSDGTGTTSFQYNQLSQIISEAKQFSGVTGSFSISYQYELGGGLKSLTNADGSTIAYASDRMGRLGAVSGQGIVHRAHDWQGGTPVITDYTITQIANSIQYRAWGDIKHAEFQDGQQYDVTFNSRLKPDEYSMDGKMAKRYSYYADGTLSFARDLLDARNDRSFSYDHLGRITKAYGGYVARGEQPNLNSPNWYDLYVPVKNDYTYNGFSNPTARMEANSRMYRTDIQYQSHDVDMLMSYTNNRGQSQRPNDVTWVYDADGRLVDEVDTWSTSRNKIEYGADGLARKTTVVGNDVQDRKTTYSDVDGKSVRHEMYSWVQVYDEEGNPLEPIENTANRYFLSSSVLGGLVVSLIYENGSIGQTNVFASGRKIATYYPNTGSYSKFIWEHTDSHRISGYQSSYDRDQYWAGAPNNDLTLPGKKEYEPNGMEMGRLPNQTDLVSSGSGGTGWSPGEVGGGWENFDCVWDGVNVPCGWTDHYTNQGGGGPVVQSPADNVASIWSNSRQRFVGLAFWDVNAAENGIAFLGRDSLGWLPTSVSYTPGSGLTGENIYQWFGGFSGNRLGSSQSNPTFISERSAQLYSMMQGIDEPGSSLAPRTRGPAQQTTKMWCSYVPPPPVDSSLAGSTEYQDYQQNGESYAWTSAAEQMGNLEVATALGPVEQLNANGTLRTDSDGVPLPPLDGVIATIFLRNISTGEIVRPFEFRRDRGLIGLGQNQFTANGDIMLRMVFGDSETLLEGTPFEETQRVRTTISGIESSFSVRFGVRKNDGVVYATDPRFGPKQIPVGYGCP